MPHRGERSPKDLCFLITSHAPLVPEPACVRSSATACQFYLQFYFVLLYFPRCVIGCWIPHTHQRNVDTRKNTQPEDEVIDTAFRPCKNPTNYEKEKKDRKEQGHHQISILFFDNHAITIVIRYG